MPHRLNTNRQFMIGNGLLAFAVIGVVVIFTLLSLHPRQGKGQPATDSYALTFDLSLAGDTLTLYLNDSLAGHFPGEADTLRLRAARTAGHNALLVVDHATDQLSILPLEGNKGLFRLGKENGKYWLNRAE